MENPENQSTVNRLTTWLTELFTLDDVNYTQSIKDIKEGVSFKGFNIWILICSILIASLGLNMNSTAVVIGAMLISPLMGPIVGIGLGVGIFDKKLIVKALKNLATATLISIITAFIFFKITPTDEVPELLSRTRPTLLDLFVAFFGGVAGILAASRCITSNVVPGVAIATALMPPLCTAGFGLAIGNWDYFAGAFYLFIMNSIMISLAALIVVLYLKYPKFSFVDKAKKAQVRTGILVVVALVLLPSVYFYYNLLQENLNNDRIEHFISKEIESRSGVYLNSHKLTAINDEIVLQVNVSGDYLDADTVLMLNERMDKYAIHAKLKVIQPQPIGFKEQRLDALRTDIIKELYDNSNQSLKSKDDEISLLKNELQRITMSGYNVEKVALLAKSQYDIEQLAVDNIIYSDGAKKDTIPTALVQWKSKIDRKTKKAQTAKLLSMLQIQLDSKKMKLVEIN